MQLQFVCLALYAYRDIEALLLCGGTIALCLPAVSSRQDFLNKWPTADVLDTPFMSDGNSVSILLMYSYIDNVTPPLVV